MSDQDTFINGIEILDNTIATSISASLYTNGGISIFSTENSINFSNGGSFLTLGGVSITKDTIIGGITSILNTTNATNSSNGSLVVIGGVGINGNLYGNLGNFNNLQSIGVTFSNVLATNINTVNLTVGTLSSTNVIFTNITNTNLISTNITVTNAKITSETVGNMLSTNLTTTNANITSETVSNMLSTNANTTNLTATNAIISSETIGNMLATNVNTINLSASNILSTNISAESLTVSTIGNIVGVIFQKYNGLPLNGSWIDMPIVGTNMASGIGHGGPGASLWIGYAGISGYWFSNSSVGDLCYRNLTGNLLFGNSAGLCTMKINNNVVNISSTIESTSPSSGSLVVNGGLGVIRSLDIGSTINATNISTGALIVSGGAGFNGAVYSTDLFTTTASFSNLLLNNITTGSVYSQNGGGILTASPLTTKGDLYVYGTSGMRLGSSTYGSVLISDTSNATGLSWQQLFDIPGNVYSDYSFSSVLATSGSTSTTAIIKTSLTTGTLQGGTYAIEIGYAITPNTSTSVNCEVDVYLNATNTTGTLIHQNITRPSQSALKTPYFDIVTQTFGNAIANVGMWFKTLNGGNTINIGQARLKLYRIQ